MATTAFIAARQSRSQTRSPLALWHLLSLDAPTVAAVWTVYAAHCFGVRVSWHAPAALAVAVWMLYAADRIADATRGRNLEERHHFHYRYRHLYAGAIAGAVPLLVLLLMLLPHAVRNTWMLLALPLAGYVVAVHRTFLRVPKEHLVAVFFAVTCFAPAALGSHNWQVFTGAMLFGGLCWLNCVALARWEHAPRPAMDAATAWAAEHLPTACAVLTCLCCFAMSTVHGRSIALPIALSSLALLLLDDARSRIKTVHLRSLADAALLTPLLTWPLLHLLAR